MVVGNKNLLLAPFIIVRGGKGVPCWGSAQNEQPLYHNYHMNPELEREMFSEGPKSVIINL